MSSTLTRSQKLQNWFRPKDIFKPPRSICYIYLEIPGHSESSELGNTKLLACIPRDYCGQTSNGPIELPGSQKLLQHFDGTTPLPVNGGSENFFIEVGISKQWTQNTVPSSIFRGCLPNVIKRWKSSTESVRPFFANNYHNWSMANRQWICRQGQQFFSHMRVWKCVRWRQ